MYINFIKAIITNEELLMNYLFSNGSNIETGNDNEYLEYEAITPTNVLYEYEKGN